MSTSKTVNVSFNQLPVTDEIINGDFLIIDNGIETRRLDFKDFIIGLDNTTFASTISTNSSNIATISAGVTLNSHKSITQYYMVNNTTPTVVGASNTFYKILGTTSSGTVIQNFINSNNRATLNNTHTSVFKLEATASVNSGNNNQVELRVGINGVTRTSSASRSTCSGSGTAENISILDIFEISPGDYVEIFVANLTGANNITVTNLNVAIIPIF